MTASLLHNVQWIEVISEKAFLFSLTCVSGVNSKDKNDNYGISYTSACVARANLKIPLQHQSTHLGDPESASIEIPYFT